MSGAGKRVAALAGAVLLVGGAVVARGALEEDEGGGGGGSDLVVGCPPELVDACMAATGRVDTLETRATAEELITTDDMAGVETDAWLVPRPWAEAVNALRTSGRLSPLPAEPGELPTVARTPIVAVLWEDSAVELESARCGGDITWTCLGEAASRTTPIGVADPGSANGLVALGAVTAGHLNDTTFPVNDIPQATGWLRNLTEAADAADRPEAVSEMLTRGAGHLTGLATTEVAALAATQSSQSQSIRVVQPDPPATVDLVVVPLNEDAASFAEDLAGDDDLLDALAEAGWRVPDHDLAPGLDPELQVPEDDGVPEGAVLHALLEEWDAL